MGQVAPVGVSAWGQPPAGDQANAVISGTFAAVGPGRPFAYRGPIDVLFGAQYNTTLNTTKGSLAVTFSGNGLGTIAAGSAVNSINLPRGTTMATTSTLALPIISLSGVVDIGRAAIRNLAQTNGLLNAPVSGPGIPIGTTVTNIFQAADPTQNPPVLGIVTLSNQPTSAQTDATGSSWFYDFQLQASAITTGVDANALFTGATITYTGNIQLERTFDGCQTFWPCNVGGSGTLASYAAGTPVSLTFGEPERQVYYRLNCLAYTPVTGIALVYRISTTGAAAETLAISSAI